ncbi:MFS transporter [Bifidobacterium sp. LC6]|uniref:MFS transporter n=1 Tax=Bifidobacterium colobi TaxID=2809026 RepID=A0ABS5UV93_9BIFI|nr:glycoside-pentoside-hexuronide (GPH):cation symporter [Bifidobacterium colobi]MBT1175029.1 MFS transporter [Bifidobacterium colobi]
MSQYTVQPSNKLSFLTKFAFGMGDFWTSIGNIAMSTYLTMFYTDVVRLSPAMVASMLLIVRLVVAFWDLTVGILVDQTKSRWGKARPWMLFGGIAYGIAFLFLFADPFGNSLAGVIYAWAVYAIVNVAYSTVNVSYASLTSLITHDTDEKTQLNIFRMTLANIAAMLMFVLVMPVVGLFPGSSFGWSLFFGVIAVMIPFGYWFTFANTREIVGNESAGNGSRASGTGHHAVADHFRALARNKYWWLTLGLNFALWMYNGIANGMAAYIAKYVLGNSNLTAVIGLATVIPLVIGLPFAGPLVARFGKRNSSLAGLALVVAGSLLVLVNPSSLWVFFVSIIVRMVGIVPMNAALNAMSADVVEYGEWKTGVRSDGMVFSSSSFSMKVAMGVSAAAIAWILGMSGYDGGAAEQSAVAIAAMVNTFVWLPIAMVVVMAVLLWFYDLDTKVAGIAVELAGRRRRTWHG